MPACMSQDSFKRIKRNAMKKIVSRLSLDGIKVDFKKYTDDYFKIDGLGHFYVANSCYVGAIINFHYDEQRKSHCFTSSDSLENFIEDNKEYFLKNKLEKELKLNNEVKSVKRLKI